MNADFRSAWRALWNAPVTTAGAILTLGLGLGSTTAIFGLFNVVLLRPLPYPDADRLVEIWGTVQRQQVERRGASFPDYFDWRDGTSSFDGMASWDAVPRILSGAGEPTQVATEVVDGPYLDLLGARAVEGRLFTDDDHRLEAPPVAVISESFRDEHLRQSPAVGQGLRLGASLFTIVGVVPADVRGRSDQAVVWTPAATTVGKAALEARGSRGFGILARLKPGITQEVAQSDIDSVSARLARDFPGTNEARSAEIVPLAAEVFGVIRPVVGLLFAVTLAVLLIACANVASLVLARAEARRHQMALRRALGASESALIRLLLAESALLVAASVVVGWLLARWTSAALIALSPVQFPSFAAPQADWRTLLFIAAAGTAITLALGGVAILAGRRTAIVQSLREDAVQTRGGGGGGGLRVILVTQVTVAVVLLVGAALLGRSLLALLAFDPGFNPDGVLSLRVQMPQSALLSSDSPPPQPNVASLPALDDLRGLPGVEQASFTTSVPLVNAGAIFFIAENMPAVDATNRPRAYVHLVTPGYFETMGMRLVEGRDFVDADMRPDNTVVVVGENLSRRFWPGQSALGRRIARNTGGPEAQWLTIVGVVREANLRGIPRNPTADPDIFGPFNPSLRGFAVLVRTKGDPHALVQPARAAIRRALPGVAVFGEQPLRALVDQRLARARFLSWLTGAFAAVALALAVIGIYGTFSYWISQRRGEIAIRAALGATRWRVVAQVVGQAAVLTVAGVAAGAVLARGLGEVLRSLLFGVQPMDVTSFAVATLVMLLAALAASLGPAVRAARINPTAALRDIS